MTGSRTPDNIVRITVTGDSPQAASPQQALMAAVQAFREAGRAALAGAAVSAAALSQDAAAALRAASPGMNLARRT